MESVRRVRKTDLARNTRQILNAVQRGQTTLIENHGEPEAAIIDIIDYRIMRAVLRYYARPPKIAPDQGLPDDEMQEVTEPQGRYNRVIAHYLAGSISLARAAELLALPSLDLRTRFLRLDVPVRSGPANEDEVWADLDAARRWNAEH